MPNQNFSVFVPEVWSSMVNEFFKERLMAANVYTDMSDEVADGGDTIHIPHIGDNFSASDVKTTNGVVTAATIDDTQTQLTIGNWKAEALLFTDYQAAQVAGKYNLQRRYIQNIGHTLARKVDDDLLGEYSNFDNTLGDSTSDFTSTNFESALSIQESLSVPREELSLIIHPRMYYGDVFKRQKYYDASQFGEASLPNGSIGRLLGVPVFRTAQIPLNNGALENQLVHPETVVFAFGNLRPPQSGNAVGASEPSGVRLQEREGEDLRVKLTGDTMYGVKTLRSSTGVRIRASNDR